MLPRQRRVRSDALESRERILAAAAELLYGNPIWNRAALTVPAVAAHAGLTERTIYRHFGSERGLRDAVMEHMLRQANSTLEGLSLDNLSDMARRLLEHSSTYPVSARTEQDPSVVKRNQRRRRLLLDATRPYTRAWSTADRRVAAAMLDVQWASVNYERLILEWGLPRKDAVRGITWVLGLIEAAIRDGDRPPHAE